MPVSRPTLVSLGDYALCAALVNGQGTPSVRLACDAPAEALLYQLGRVQIP